MLSNVLHVPSISKCWIYVSQLDTKGFRVSFGYVKVIIDEGRFIIGEGHMKGGMYKLDEAPQNYIIIFGDSSCFPTPNTEKSLL